MSLHDVVSLQEKKAGSRIQINYESIEAADERGKKGDFMAYIKARWAEGQGTVGPKEQLSNGLYPGWNPKKVAEFVVDDALFQYLYP